MCDTAAWPNRRLKKHQPSTADLAQWLEGQPAHQRALGLISGQEHVPGWGTCRRQLIDVSLSHRRFSLSSPLSPHSTFSENQWEKYPRVRIKSKHHQGLAHSHRSRLPYQLLRPCDQGRAAVPQPGRVCSWPTAWPLPALREESSHGKPLTQKQTVLAHQVTPRGQSDARSPG